MLRRTLFALAATAFVPFAGSALAAETGTLKVKFVYGGDPPEQPKIDPNKDVDFCGKFPLLDESLIVNPDNKGIKNVVLYVYTGRGGSKLPKMKLEAAKHTLANQGCRFEPHVVIAKKGDTLVVTNPDQVGHNANFNFFKNPAQNFTIPPGGEKDVDLKEAEPAPIPVECNIHPWMKSIVVVQDHPFVAVSDENGDLVIEGLPAGEELVFRVYQEAAQGAIDKVTVDGKPQEWKKNNFEVEIKPGTNDLGTIEIPAEAFQK